MKKVLTLTALIIITLSTSIYAQDDLNTVIIGKWKLNSVFLEGNKMMAEDMGFEGFMTFKEDKTAVFEMMGEVETIDYRIEGNLIYEGDVDTPSKVLEYNKDRILLEVITEDDDGNEEAIKMEFLKVKS